MSGYQAKGVVYAGVPHYHAVTVTLPSHHFAILDAIAAKHNVPRAVVVRAIMDETLKSPPVVERMLRRSRQPSTHSPEGRGRGARLVPMRRAPTS